MRETVLIWLMQVPSLCLADLQKAGAPPPPATPLDGRNAIVSLTIQWAWIVISLAALAWIIWWGVRTRRR
jgi:hypothetical protein